MELDDQDHKILHEYGRTMLFVQMFEFGLIQLAHLQQPEPQPGSSVEDVMRTEVLPLFKSTAGAIAQKLKVPMDIANEIQTAVNTRNTLAHEYLRDYRLARATGQAEPQEIVEELQTLALRFSDVTEALGRKSDAILRERGIDPDEDPFLDTDVREVLKDPTWQQQGAA